jgi:subtilisin family serine protease
LRWTRTPRSLSPLAALAVVALLLLTPGGHGASSREEAVDAARWAGLVGGERRPVALGQRMIVVLKEPSLADQVAPAGGRAGEAQMRAWTSAAVASQKQLAARLARAGFLLTPEFTFSRVLNGFSAPLDPRGVALLERDPDVAGVYAVRTAYPASVSSSELGRAGRTLGPAFKIAGRDGTGVTVALLDTGVDRSHPYLRDRVLEGIDVLAPDSTAVARQHPLIPGRPERHGTELAGIVAGHGGPNGISGVAPGVTILPIRIAGWQPDAAGGFAIYGRTDQLIAGLDRAVDPNGDGDAHDAARVALVGVAEPFAGFASGAVAQAVEGATKLDTLVVAPAGNDGPSGPSYGSVAGPGGAPDALTVAAGDERVSIETVRVLVRAGLDVLVDAPLPLGGAVEARHPVTLALAVPGPADPRLPPDRRAFARFFDRKGFSVVAGRAALVPEGNALLEAQRDAAQAGAAAVVIDGVAPAGSLGLDERVGVPVVGIPHVAADAVRKALAQGADVTISLGDPGTARNPRAGGIASFSSRGLAFAGGVKPEVAAPGIALATSEPGRNDDRTANYGTVNGTSASAAVVAGAAALLAQSRPACEVCTSAPRALRRARRCPRPAARCSTSAARSRRRWEPSRRRSRSAPSTSRDRKPSARSYCATSPRGGSRSSSTRSSRACAVSACPFRRGPWWCRAERRRR